MKKMRVLIDAFGGDKAPEEIIKGSRMAADEFEVEITLFGNENKIKKTSDELGVSLEGIKIVNTNEIILPEDEAIEIIKSKKDSSMACGLKALALGEGDVFISAGNSGALLAGASLIVKRKKNIRRIAFAPLVPRLKGSFILIDGGANASCTPEILLQFGIMGFDYAKNKLKIENPRVGLLNIGTEPTKGDALRKDAFELFCKEKDINFIGNIEAREAITKDTVDVVVSDGFTGNIFVKLYEGMAEFLIKKFNKVLLESIKSDISEISEKIKKIKKEIDYSEHGGAPLLGVLRPVFKAHGNSDAKTIKNAIKMALLNAT
ncbi:MAG: phosphate acyltransferase PlsX [Oscillospiraceae bacterium]|jgi:glycerol-3-phosphate acyltransferase PlsX|nr:phosphate acyltransferase PlsX [Oscillospiraceae bacterium]